jgi:HipA-like protein
MRKAAVYRSGILAGILYEESMNHYVFRYDDTYFSNPEMPAISLTMPKTQQEFCSDVMFPFFSNMIAEGSNLDIQSHYLKIDKNDILSLLLATAGSDTTGAITVKPAEE